MKLFIDSANIEEIEIGYSAGILDGITTNPSLMKKAAEKLKIKGEKIDLDEYIKKILTIAKGTPVSLEVTKTNFEGMIEEGQNLYKRFNQVANNVVIKIPINTSLEPQKDNFDGIKAIKELSRKCIPVNCTLIFTPEQAMMAAKAGAKMVSPFAGRIDDYIRKKMNIKFDKSDYFPAEGINGNNDNGIFSGVDLVMKCVEIFKQHNIKAEVLAASIRNAQQLRECALVGAHISTVPFNVLNEVMVHPKTIEGMKDFMKDTVEDYSKIGGEKK